MGGYYDSPRGFMLRGQLGMAVSNFIDNIPNMSDYEIGHAFGYGVEKLVESAALTRGLGLGTNVAFRGGIKLWPAASNGKTVLNGIEYTTHALERMQPVGTIMKGSKVFSRGVPPSVVQNAIKFGKVTPGNTAAEVVRTFENVRVITNTQGTRVISVIKLGH